jgi:Uma2 family endonuclease
MGAVTTTTSGSGPFTVRDLEGMPDDGRRYELIDGVLFVSPAPGLRRQTIAYELYGVLSRARPPQFGLAGAPFAVHQGDVTELQPDIVVGRIQDFTEKDLPALPVLVVEVLSPSTALNDLNTKKAAYQRLGVPSYWVIGPQRMRLTVFELRDGGYLETVSVTGSEAYQAEKPFPVRIVPVDLLGWLPR